MGQRRACSAACAFALLVTCCILARGQEDQRQRESKEQTQAPLTVFPHPDSRFWVSGQANIIGQGHPAFHAAYSGPNSTRSDDEFDISQVFTLYTGWRVTDHLEFLVDIESTGGRGISSALGLAGFTNLDVVRNPSLGRKPYFAREMIHYVIPLGGATADADRNQMSLFAKLPERRLELRLGRFSNADFFDLNAVASDSHLQFLNWTVDNNGAYDYAADTRGYTYGFLAELHDPRFTLRFAETLMPKVANGLEMDWNLARARAENVESELHRKWLPGRETVLRLLAFVNHGNMGDYREANALLAGGKALPDTAVIEQTRRQGRIKYGFGLNLEQPLTDTTRVFFRTGWNDGRHESFAYTEVHNTFQAGGDMRGDRWGRHNDKIGLAFVSNGLSDEHRRYLELGGLGFLLGDGRLNYGRETIVETYYNLHVWRGIYGGPDVQFIAHPGYNRDRGPVVVPAVRLHLEL